MTLDQNNESLLEILREKSYVNTSSEKRARNIRSSIKRKIPCITFGFPNKRKIAVIGSAPSVNDDLEDIINFDGFKVAINGSHDWLIEKGIIPDAVLVADASPLVADFFKNPQEDTTYLVCSSCDPSVFNALEGQKLILWHAALEDSVVGSLGVITGPSAATTAPYLLYMIGYREVHLFGVDSSLNSCESHVYSGGDPGETKIQVMVGENIYLSTVQYVLQIAHLRDLDKLLKKHLKLYIHGYGLAKAIFENNGEFELI